MIPKWMGWETVRLLGAGSYGKVYQIQKIENGEIHNAALKVISIPETEEDIDELYESGMANNEAELDTYLESVVCDLTREVDTMFALKECKNIVRFDSHMIIHHEGWKGVNILIKMELLTPLKQYLSKLDFDESLIIRLGRDICNALNYCHSQNPTILHRDIKSGNIMVDSAGNFKLGDFGVARTLEGTKSAHTRVGTEGYMAPEVLLNKVGYGITADIYSLGIVLYKLLNRNRMPFMPTEGSMTIQMREDAKIKRLYEKNVPMPVNGSYGLKQVVLKAIEYDPENRFQTAAEFYHALEKCLLEKGDAFNSNMNDETTDDTTLLLYKEIIDNRKVDSDDEFTEIADELQSIVSERSEQSITEKIHAKVNLNKNEAYNGSDDEKEELNEQYEDVFNPFKSENVKQGDIICLGSYYSGRPSQDEKSEIEWIVLRKNRDAALLISKYALDCLPYNTEYKRVNWENSTIRKWLNETFFAEAFCSNEQEKILPTNVLALPNPKYATDTGNNTVDRVFLISAAEAEDFFRLDSERECKPTGYTASKGAHVNSSNGNCWWWLRTPGYNSNNAVTIGTEGEVVYLGNNVYGDYCTVRPAITVKLEQ